MEPHVELRPMLVAKSKARPKQSVPPARDVPDPVPRLDLFFLCGGLPNSILKIYRVDFCFM